MNLKETLHLLTGQVTFGNKTVLYEVLHDQVIKEVNYHLPRRKKKYKKLPAILDDLVTQPSLLGFE